RVGCVSEESVWVVSWRGVVWNIWVVLMFRHTKITAASSIAITAMRPVASGLRVSGWVWSDMAVSHAAFLISMMRTLSQRLNAISDTKKMIEGSSKTPSVMCWKLAKNDIESTESMTKPGAH